MTSSPPPSPRYASVQMLRGVAAMMVVIYHIMLRVAEHRGVPEAQVYPNFAAGVDVFFVISGFVMALSSRPLAHAANGWKIFMRRRIIRIVPLYWILTTLKVLLLLFLGHASLIFSNVLATYFFLPSRDARGEIRTIIPAGWTLSFEMLFYTLFAVSLMLRIRPLPFLVPIFLLLAGGALLRADDWPACSFFLSAFPLEFLFGVFIAQLVDRKLWLRPAWGFALLGLSIFALFVLPVGPVLGVAEGVGRVTLRVLTWGLPAMGIVYALVVLEEKIRSPRALLVLGDASYALYLTHGFILAVMPLLLARGWPDYLLGLVMVEACAGVGILTHRLVEAPLLKRLV